MGLDRVARRSRHVQQKIDGRVGVFLAGIFKRQMGFSSLNVTAQSSSGELISSRGEFRAPNNPGRFGLEWARPAT
jgi:hypothetical protein